MMRKTAIAKRWSFLVWVILTAWLLALPASAAEMHQYPAEPDLIEIMFIQESQVRLDGGFPVDYSGLNATDGVDAILAAFGGGEWERIADIPELVLDDLAETASVNLGEPVYNLNNIYRIRLLAGPPPDPVIVAFELENLQGVHLAYPVALPPELPVPSDFTPIQNYLDPASSIPTGVDARYAWTQTGGTGTGVTVCDLEYSWNYNHSDVTKALGSQINSNVADPFADTNHGTAVIGQLVSDSNGWGTTGTSYGASLKTCGTYYGPFTPSWNITGAIAIAATNLSNGDVMLLEQQWDYTGNNGYVPVEWYPQTTPLAQGLTAVFAAIQNAVGNGISVVEAGGNGGVNTDTMTWYGDSGAVIVGAGGAYLGGTYPFGNLQKLWYSSYGTRFDVHAWGENVVTTGYGDHHGTEGFNLWFTNTFNGTSSASPIVAGAIACMNGYYAANVSTTPMTPAAIRSTLVATGTAQVMPPAGNIGPRPDLYAAIQTLVVVPPASWTDVTTGPLGDTGFGKSVAWGDVDGDGDDDLYITNAQSQNRLLRNDGAGVFTDITTPVEGNFMFAAAAEFGDMDNDGDLDIYCGNWGGPNRLFRNDGPGLWFDVSIPPIDNPMDGSGVAWVDFDNDMLLDLHVTSMNGGMCFMFQNSFAGMWNDVTMPPMDYPFDSHDAAWSDFDNDKDMDCYIVNQMGFNDLMRNDGPAGFFPIPDPVLNDPAIGSGAAWGDFDNDGFQDLYLANQTTVNRLMQNAGGAFIDVTTGPLGDPGISMGASWADYDNDGDLDIYLANLNTANKLLRNDGGGMWTDDTNGPLGDLGGSHGTAWADFDNDGDLDIYLMNAGSSNRLFRNDINNGNNWVQFAINGTNSNMSAIGAKVKIVCAGQGQWRELGTAAGYCSQNSFRVHFGIGNLPQVDVLEIHWPGNGVETFYNLAPNQLYHFVQSPWSDVGENTTPTVCRLLPGAPNPFNPMTTIRFEVTKAGLVDVEVFDAAGRRVRTLFHGEKQAGPHSLIWQGRDDAGRALPSGVYFARMRAEGEFFTTKLVLAK